MRRDGLRFSFVAFDGGYGHLPWLLRELDGEGETFLAEVHSDQAIFLDDPAPAVPEGRSSKGRAPCRLRSDASPTSVTAWTAAQPAAQWRRLSVRSGEKGEVIADYLTRRIWVWDGQSPSAHCWHLLVRREMDGTTGWDNAQVLFVQCQAGRFLAPSRGNAGRAPFCRAFL